MIYKLKIKRWDVGRKVPFPLVYLFNAAELDRMRAAFPSFIGFPARHHMQIDWGSININDRIEGVTRADKEELDKPLKKVIPDLFRKEDPWHFAVPILNRSKAPRDSRPEPSDRLPEEPDQPEDARHLYGGQVDYREEGDESQGLAYLSDKQWKPGKKPSGNNNLPERARPYPDTAYFATRDEVYEQVCHACPRYAYHVSGDCFLGDAVCFKAFREYFAPNMFKRLKEYDTFIESIEESEKSHDVRQD